MGLLHIYCGDGKGKTTASLGLLLRMSGAGMKIRFVQFMKGGESAELSSLKLIPGVTVMRCDKEYGFFSTLSDSDKADLTRCHDRLISDAFSGEPEAVILDEFNIAYKYGLIDRENSEKLILGSLQRCEIVLTGRDPAKVFIDAADYISEIKCVRHPYMKGIGARKGIEY